MIRHFSHAPSMKFKNAMYSSILVWNCLESWHHVWMVWFSNMRDWLLQRCPQLLPTLLEIVHLEALKCITCCTTDRSHCPVCCRLCFPEGQEHLAALSKAKLVVVNQELLPEELRPYMGRPAVSTEELLNKYRICLNECLFISAERLSTEPLCVH